MKLFHRTRVMCISQTGKAIVLFSLVMKLVRLTQPGWLLNSEENLNVDYGCYMAEPL